MSRAIEIEALKQYCSGVSALTEGGITYLYLQELRLPKGCTPPICDALLCPSPRDGYPSRLFLSTRVSVPIARNWNCDNARIGERNWHAFSWKVTLSGLTLPKLLLAHLNGFVKEA